MNKRKIRQELEWKVPFIDFQVGLLSIFLLITIFVLALASTDDQHKKSGLEQKAEYIVFTTWNDKEDCDVDTWVKDPLGLYVSFKTKSNEFITLDRDDRGIQLDTYTGPDGKTYIYPDNKEMLTFRKVIPGDYKINLHLYNCRVNGSPKNPGDAYELTATVELFKLNPVLKSVYKKDITFKRVWDEETVVHFSLDEHGEFKYIDDAYEKMITDSGPSANSYSIPSENQLRNGGHP